MVTLYIIVEILKKIKMNLGTVFMYGQTGSGKTFTMMGTLYEQMQSNNTKSPNEKTARIKEIESNGVIMHAIRNIFEKIAEVQ